MDYPNDQSFKIATATFTCITALVLFVTFFTALTRFRLWHTNRFLERALDLVDHPLTYFMSLSTAYLTGAEYRNDLYMIWLVVLLIAYDNVITISAASAPSSTWILREYVQLFLALYSGFSIVRTGVEMGVRDYYVPLLVLWLLVLVKFSFRLVFHRLVERAYGLNNTKLVSDYMKVEHEQSKPNETVDPNPITMEGYKYLVLGEWNMKTKLKAAEYTAEIILPPDVVTVERVWSCNERLLHPSIDQDHRLKDVSLSFALFKLLKRRFFEYPAAEAQQEKTRKLVFDGLLSRHSDAVYRVIGMEICFLRDFFYTRYPVIFASGFPVFHLITLAGMLGVSLWISAKAFHRRWDPQNSYLRSKHTPHNVDYTITNILLIIIVVMETLETMFYVFSDWTKVMLICRHVRTRILRTHCFLDKVLALLCKGEFSRSLNNTIGQYSLLKHYKKSNFSRLNVNWFRDSKLLNCFRDSTLLNCFRGSTSSNCVRDSTSLNCFHDSTSEWSPIIVEALKGLKRDKSVILSPDVKEAIICSLRKMNGDLTNGVSTLKTNGVYGDLGWTCALKSEYQTLVVWHIATDLCGIHPIKAGTGGDRESINPYHLVASHLSNYCTYLMVFLPDMLPQSSLPLPVKLFFREILLETKEFFQEASSREDEYRLMMRFEGSGNRVTDMGVRLGRYLMDIDDDAKRWKIMAEFWSEFIIFLAPSGKHSAHMDKLKSGGEFITHLWALLYHAGITELTRTTTASYAQQYP